jgi:hypothetical protein
VELKQHLSVFFASYTHQSSDVRTRFVGCVADVLATVSYSGKDSLYYSVRWVGVCESERVCVCACV